MNTCFLVPTYLPTLVYGRQVGRCVELCHLLLQSLSHKDVDEAGELVKDAVRDLTETVQKTSNEMGVINGLLEDIHRAAAAVSCKRWMVQTQQLVVLALFMCILGSHYLKKLAIQIRCFGSFHLPSSVRSLK